MAFVNGLLGFFAVICLFVIISATGTILLNYKKRQLVKANFWLNVAIFALIVIISLIVIIDTCITDNV
jgi:hypothetical protein